MCKKVLGKFPHDLINEMLLWTRKSYWKQTSLSIKEIAYKIGWTMESKWFWYRFFKSQTGNDANRVFRVSGLKEFGVICNNEWQVLLTNAFKNWNFERRICQHFKFYFNEQRILIIFLNFAHVELLSTNREQDSSDFYSGDRGTWMQQARPFYSI